MQHTGALENYIKTDTVDGWEITWFSVNVSKYVALQPVSTPNSRKDELIF